MEKKLPSVSFIVTVYNKENYLERVLKALKEQKGNFDKEYIFIDDCSTDNSLQVLRKLTKGWKNLIIIVHEKNQGLCEATKTGIKAAKNDYVKLLDADDVLMPEATRILLEACIKYDCKGAVARHAKFENLAIIDRFTKNEVSAINDNNPILVMRKPLKQAIEGHIFTHFNSQSILESSLAKKLINTLDFCRGHQDCILAIGVSMYADIAFVDGLAIYEYDQDEYKLSVMDEDIVNYNRLKILYNYVKKYPFTEVEIKWFISEFIKLIRLEEKSRLKRKNFRKIRYIFSKILKIKKEKNIQNNYIEIFEKYLEMFKNKYNY
ncbi:MAG: glycosyltransferase family 2 protein [Candidatus Thorarchaeota archaeon]